MTQMIHKHVLVFSQMKTAYDCLDTYTYARALPISLKSLGLPVVESFGQPLSYGGTSD